MLCSVGPQEKTIGEYQHALQDTMGYELASFPGLHAQLLSLAVRKAGEGLDGFIT